MKRCCTWYPAVRWRSPESNTTPSMPLSRMKSNSPFRSLVKLRQESDVPELVHWLPLTRNLSVALDPANSRFSHANWVGPNIVF